ncbi:MULTISPECIES: hypothetical protein [unclassified Streptomyces]|uniref:hypothetical protein n=1 Tax=unclassified Streptomyces TaxID=2593676 RepID=UPI001F0FF3DB|nr:MULTISPECIES: hypothetical protein [unclassified Streptomyces]
MQRLDVANPMSNPLAEEALTKGDQYVTGYLAAGHWLLSAAEDTRRARKEWADSGIALLRCGTLFTAVRLSAELVHAAAGTEDLRTVDTYLAQALLGGPAFADTRWGLYYALVPPGTARLRQWEGRTLDAECLGRNSYLGVPDPARTDPDDGSSYWSVPVDGPGLLGSPGAVAQLLVCGRHRLAAERNAGA